MYELEEELQSSSLECGVWRGILRGKVRFEMRKDGVYSRAEFYHYFLFLGKVNSASDFNENSNKIF